MSLRLVACLAAALLPAPPATASDWSRYANARFGYAVDVPPGFSAIREAENGDGGTATSPTGDAVLSVWGANLLDESFVADARARIASAEREGWAIGFRTVSGRGASWSGTRAGRIVYVRAVPRCRDRAAYARIAYDAVQKAAFDPVVSRLARSLNVDGRC